MKNKKIMTIITMILCVMLIGSSLVGCSSSEKESEKGSSKSKSEKSVDEEEDSEDEDSEDEENTDDEIDPDEEDSDEEDSEAEKDSDDEDDSDDKGKINDEDDLLPDSIFVVSGVEINKIDPEEFENVVCEILDCSEDDIQEDHGMYLYYGEYIDKYQIELLECDDEDEVKEKYRKEVNNFLDFECDGKLDIYDNYFVFDAAFDDGKHDYEFYGGVYISGTSVIFLYSATGEDSDRETVDSILTALDLPKP